MTAPVRRFDLVMFDLDGTLVETAGEIHEALNRTLAAMGLGPAPLAQVEAWIGHGVDALLLQALAQSTATPADAVADSARFADARVAFRKHYAGCCGTLARPYPGAVEALETLRRAGTRTAVVTNKERALTLRVLDGQGLTPLLDRIVTPELAGAAKPDPAGLLDCLRTFGVPPARALFVGDSAIDVAAARSAGVPVWAVPYGYNGGRPVADSAPDRVISNLQTLTKELQA